MKKFRKICLMLMLVMTMQAAVGPALPAAQTWAAARKGLVKSGKKYYYYNQYDKSDYSADTDPCYEDTYNPLERGWYKEGLDKEKFTFVGSPYTSHDTGATVITMARKIKLKPVSKQNRNNNHKHSDKRKHVNLKNGR